MANINLAVKPEEASIKKDVGLLVVFVLFLLTIAAYGGMYFYYGSLEQKLTDLDNQYKTQLAVFATSNAKEVLDYQSRLGIAKTLTEKSRSISGDFTAVENAIISGVYIDSYSYNNTEGAIKLICNADDYETMAKQILGFKSSSAFSSVLAGESSFSGEAKKLTFPIVLRIK